MADVNTGREGKGQAGHEELERHQGHGASLTRRTEGFRSAPMCRGKVQGLAACRLKFRPQRGLTPRLSTAACCQTGVPLLLPSSSCFSQRGCQCFAAAKTNSPCGEVPCRMRGPEQPLQGHRSQADTLLTSAGSSYFTCLSTGAAAGCVGHRQ